MIVPRYATGAWFAVVTDGTVALLEPGTPADVVHAVWQSLRDGADTSAQLQPLLGGGLAAMPPFALVTVAGGAVRAIVRGAAVVEVAGAAGTREVTGGRAATWVEEVVPDAAWVTVRAPGAASGDDGLPVLSGVVRAGAVHVALRGAPDRVAPEPVRAAEPVVRRLPEPAPVPLSVPEPVRVAVAAPVPVLPEPVLPAPVLPEPEPAPVAAAPEPPAPEPVLPEPVAPEPAPVVAALPVPPPPVVPPAPVVLPAPVAGDGLELPLVLTGAPEDEDHDGLTVLTSDIVALRGQLPHLDGPVPGPLAVPTARTRPPARVALSTGAVVSLERPVLIGRAPQVSRVANAQLPRLVTVPSPTSDISRTHAQVRQDGDDVLVTDLHSTNGVVVTRVGAAPQRLHPGEPSVVEPGDVIDIGDGVTFTVELGA